MPPDAPQRVPVPRHAAPDFPGPARIPLAQRAEPGLAGAGAAPAPPPAAPSAPARRPPRRWQVTSALLLLSTALLAAGTTYLWRTTEAWERRAGDYEAVSIGLGAELADTRLELEDTTAQVEAITAQLQTAQERIIELADEKAQIGDDREAQRLLADYQERVTDAAGRVALALDQCVRGQNQLIGYLQNAELYEPEDLAAYTVEVADLCQAATDANTALQGELAR